MKSAFISALCRGNTIGNMNKTQANRTQTAAVAAGYMGEWSSPYVCDPGGTRGDETTLIVASTILSNQTEPGCFVHNSAFL